MRRFTECARPSAILCLLIGSSLVLSHRIYQAVKARLKPATVEMPTEFDFPTHARIPGQPRFTVAGTVENNGDRNWAQARIIVSIHAGTAFMTYCWGDVSELPAHAVRPFRVVCKHTEGSGIPDNVSYRLSVREAVPGP